MFVISSVPLYATTCVAGRKFKVHELCGTVADKQGAVIPDAKVQVTPKGQPEEMKELSSDQEGRFAFQTIADGEYELRVKYSGFWDAWQPFVVSGSSSSRKCNRPIRIVMVPAGGCSYVENAWKKSELKK
jgi:hypothetical protein